MKPEKIKLFKKQPKLTKHDVMRLTRMGLLVPEKSPRKRANCEDEITNSNAGDVVSYRPLNEVLRKKVVDQDDARRLLAIETSRNNGKPRESHIRRFMVLAFSSDRVEVKEKIKNLS